MFFKGGEINLKYARLLSLILITVLISSSFAFAGAPAPTTERPYHFDTGKVSQPAAPKAPAAPKLPASEKVSPVVISKHFTWGLGLGGNPILGYVEKDQYGYPRTEYTGPFYGINWVLGFGVTWYKGQPSAEDMNAAVQRIKKANPSVSDKELPLLVRKELGNSVTYVGLGTALIAVPVNAEMGIQWILSDNCRTRLGIGLPTLLCFGINWDF